jgi:hypothetical protein
MTNQIAQFIEIRTIWFTILIKKHHFGLHYSSVTGHFGLQNGHVGLQNFTSFIKKSRFGLREVNQCKPM